MNQFEKDTVKTYMRKLARIAKELNDIAFEMADFEGGEYKSPEEAQPEIEGASYAHGHPELDRPGIDDERDDYGSRTEKIYDLREQIAEQEMIIQDAKTQTHARMKARNSLNVLKGHLTRIMNQVAEIKSASKEGQWKSQVR